MRSAPANPPDLPSAVSSSPAWHTRRPRSTLILAVFVVAQIADGTLTYAGVRTFGIEAEGNHLLSWWMYYVGPEWALTGAKVMAIGCGAILHATGLHAVLGVLTGLYLLFALGPWVVLLSS